MAGYQILRQFVQLVTSTREEYEKACFEGNYLAIKQVGEGGGIVDSRYWKETTIPLWSCSSWP